MSCHTDTDLAVITNTQSLNNGQQITNSHAIYSFKCQANNTSQNFSRQLYMLKHVCDCWQQKV